MLSHFLWGGLSQQDYLRKPFIIAGLRRFSQDPHAQFFWQPHLDQSGSFNPRTPLRAQDRNFFSICRPSKHLPLTDFCCWGNIGEHLYIPPKRLLTFSKTKCLAPGHFYFEPFSGPELWLWVFALHITSILVSTANVKVMTCDSFSGAPLKMLKEKCVTRWPSEVTKRNLQRGNLYVYGWPQWKGGKECLLWPCMS